MQRPADEALPRSDPAEAAHGVSDAAASAVMAASDAAALHAAAAVQPVAQVRQVCFAVCSVRLLPCFIRNTVLCLASKLRMHPH